MVAISVVSKFDQVDDLGNMMAPRRNAPTVVASMKSFSAWYSRQRQMSQEPHNSSSGNSEQYPAAHSKHVRDCLGWRLTAPTAPGQASLCRLVGRFNGRLMYTCFAKCPLVPRHRGGAGGVGPTAPHSYHRVRRGPEDGTPRRFVSLALVHLPDSCAPEYIMCMTHGQAPPPPAGSKSELAIDIPSNGSVQAASLPP